MGPGKPPDDRRHEGGILSFPRWGDANRPPGFRRPELATEGDYLPLSPRPEMISSFGLAPTI